MKVALAADPPVESEVGGDRGHIVVRELRVEAVHGDLERHAQDFAGRRGFTYTVLSPGDGDVIGCVYIYPRPGDSQPDSSAGRPPARVRSWVRADHADLDPVLYRTVLAWLQSDWPFPSIDYAPRP